MERFALGALLRNRDRLEALGGAMAAAITVVGLPLTIGYLLRVAAGNPLIDWKNDLEDVLIQGVFSTIVLAMYVLPGPLLLVVETGDASVTTGLTAPLGLVGVFLTILGLWLAPAAFIRFSQAETVPAALGLWRLVDVASMGLYVRLWAMWIGSGIILVAISMEAIAVSPITWIGLAPVWVMVQDRFIEVLASRYRQLIAVETIDDSELEIDWDRRLS